jgi:hypothetical protein
MSEMIATEATQEDVLTAEQATLAQLIILNAAIVVLNTAVASMNAILVDIHGVNHAIRVTQTA